MARGLVVPFWGESTMKRMFTICVLLSLMLSILVVSAIAAGDYTIRRVDPQAVQSLDATRIPAPCTVGNLNPPAFAVSSWLTPPDKYALIFDPGATCLDCDIGVRITSVHTMLQTSAACDLVMKVSLLSVDTTVGANCPEPLAVLCGHTEFQVSLPSDGLWDISLPLDCLCADPEYKFALKVKIVSATCTDGLVPNLVTDAYPSACTSYNEIAGVWTDIVSAYGFPGNLMIWADAECCYNAVGNESETWGAIKSIYR